MLAKWRGLGDEGFGVEGAQTEASERLESGGALPLPQRSFLDLNTSEAGPQESSGREAPSSVGGGAGLGEGYAWKTQVLAIAGYWSAV